MSDRALSRATDRAIREENRRAIADAHEAQSMAQPIYPAETPEYEAYAAALRAELAKWVKSEPPYSSVVLDTMEA